MKFIAKVEYEYEIEADTEEYAKVLAKTKMCFDRGNGSRTHGSCNVKTTDTPVKLLNIHLVD